MEPIGINVLLSKCSGIRLQLGTASLSLCILVEISYDVPELEEEYVYISMHCIFVKFS